MVTVKTLIEACDKTELFSEYLKLCHNVSPEYEDEFKKMFFTFLERLKAIVPEEHNNEVILNYMVYDVNMEEVIDSSCFYLNEIYQYFRENPIFEKRNLTTDSILTLTEEEYHEIAEEIKKYDIDPNKTVAGSYDGYVESYGYEFSQWKEILGYMVDEKMAEEFGTASYLSYILYEMTFIGYDEERRNQERQKLDDAIKELEEIKNLPEEEQHFHTIENVVEIDEITEQEKESMYKEMEKLLCVNHFNKYIALKTFIARNKDC